VLSQNISYSQRCKDIRLVTLQDDNVLFHGRLEHLALSRRVSTAPGRPFIVDISEAEQNVGVISLLMFLLEILKFVASFVGVDLVQEKFSLDAELVDWLSVAVLLGLIQDLECSDVRAAVPCHIGLSQVSIKVCGFLCNNLIVELVSLLRLVLLLVPVTQVEESGESDCSILGNCLSGVEAACFWGGLEMGKEFITDGNCFLEGALGLFGFAYFESEGPNIN
jgi:hypothetical protein